MFRSTYSSSSSYLMLRIIFIIIIFLGSNFFQFSTTESIQDYCGYGSYSSSDGYIRCGGIDSVTLKYPFWSMDDKELLQRRHFCGYPGLGITCSRITNKIILNISNQSYYVIQPPSSDENQQITIVDPDLVDKICPRPSRNFTIDQNFSSSSHSVILREVPYNLHLEFFLNCTSPPPPPPQMNSNQSQDLKCLAYNDKMRSYGFLVEDIYKESDLKLLADWNGNYCRESVIVPVTDFDFNNNVEYLKALETGFMVHWTPPIECERCESSGGFCSYNETESTYTCWCRKGQLIRQATNYTCSQHNDTLHADTGYTLPAYNTLHADKSMHNKILIIGVFAGVGGLMFIILLFVYRNNQKKRRGSIAKNVELFLESYGCHSLQRYKYKDIKKMTNYFKDKLGQGGYGSVYKGKLVDGRPVAVKVLINDPKKNTNGEDFMNEVATIGRTNHVNIVALLGFCSSGSKRALVYEFMTNGSLEKFIYAEKEKNTIIEGNTASTITTSTSSSEVHPLGLGLGWKKLYQIAIGIARGLEYLHRGCNTGRILHFDIKPHNILLDENFCPKISDFGLAKLCPTRESIVSMLSGGRGTIGYIAPEVYNRNYGGVSYKSDVYSYGMMVLEMVGGRKNIDPFVENTSEIYFPHWIYNRMEKDHNKIEGLLKFEGAFYEEMAKKMIMVGLWCIQTHQECRPSMGRVAEMLEGSIKDLQMPPNPFGEPSLHPPLTS